MFLSNKNNSLAWVKAGYNAYGKGEDPYYAPLLKDNNVFDLISIAGEKF